MGVLCLIREFGILDALKLGAQTECWLASHTRDANMLELEVVSQLNGNQRTWSPHRQEKGTLFGCFFVPCLLINTLSADFTLTSMCF